MAIETLYPAIRPSLNLDFANTKVLDPRITFSRASAATYYDGKTVAKAEENLFPQSQNFADNAWVRSECTVAAGAIAPDGTATAFKVSATSAQAYHSLRQSIAPSGLATAETAVASFFVKAAEYTKACISDLSVGRASAVFDLVTQTATLVAAPGNISASIVSIGSGWFRCSIAFSKGSANISIGIVGYPDSVPPNQYGVSYIGDGNSGIYVWGAQLEQRSQVTAYTPTTTQPITNYIPVLQTAPAGVPRFDHNPVTGESLGLLAEEQRTNLLTYSEQLDNSSWSKVDAAVAANSFVAPDGSLTADVVAVMASGGYIAKTAVVGATSGQTYSISIFTNTLDRKLTFGGATPNYLNASYSSTPIGNGWYRHTGTVTLNADGPVQLVLNKGAGGAGASFAAWGAQAELGAFPTSYIKTEASQVTRAADSAQMTGANFSSWYRQDEGTIAVESILRSVIGTDAYVAAISGGNIDNTIRLGHLTNGNARRLNVRVNAVNTVALDIFPASVPDVVYKQSASYKVNDFATSSNGSNVAKTATGAIPYNLDKLVIGASALYVRRIAYYPKRLTDAQLQALTA